MFLCIFFIRPNFYFNPRSPWGERLVLVIGFPLPELISIHAPRGGSDDAAGIATAYKEISIHAPRGGSDRVRAISNW